MEHRPDNQGALDSRVRIESRPSPMTPRASLGSPAFDGLLIDPEGQAASLDECPVVLGPVSDPLPEDEVCLGRHPRILRRADDGLAGGSATTPIVPISIAGGIYRQTVTSHLEGVAGISCEQLFSLA